jgi:hypothetical protein
VSNLQIAHIRAAERGGPRYVANMTDEQRRAFSNLILLCKAHHDIVDKLRVQDFSIETLGEWKAEREATHQAELSRLREVTPEGLQKLIAETLKDRDERILKALDRLEVSDAEGARLLRDMVEELALLRRSRYLDPGMAEEFTRAANNLYRVFRSGALEQFTIAARDLRRLPDR